MKVRLTLKDPDGVYECVKEAIQETIPDGLSKDEEADLIESRMEDAQEKMRKWVQYKEYVTVEIDTESGEAVVIPVRS